MQNSQEKVGKLNILESNKKVQERAIMCIGNFEIKRFNQLETKLLAGKLRFNES